MAKIYLPGHPRLAPLHEELKEAQEKLELELTLAQTRFDLEYRRLVDKQADFSKRIPEYQDIVRRHEYRNREYLDILVQQKTWQSLQDSLSKITPAILLERMLADKANPTTLTFKAIDAITKQPVTHLHVTVIARGEGQFVSEQTLRTGVSPEVAIPITGHLQGGFSLNLNAPGYQPFKFKLAAAELLSLSRDATIELSKTR